jgi:predicted metal-dependent hydrolase
MRLVKYYPLESFPGLPPPRDYGVMETMFGAAKASTMPSRQAMLPLGARWVSVQFVHNPRARRYLLRVKADGEARVTVPRQGSWEEAERFVRRHQGWLEQQLIQVANRPVIDHTWKVGTSFIWRGEPVELQASPDGKAILFLQYSIPMSHANIGLQRLVEVRLRRLAAPALTNRTLELSRQLQIPIQRVSIRDQRSRWGSCSVQGTISLNWRLCQMPDWVRDYVIIHELMHRLEMNHSLRFWHRVWEVCPHYREAIGWIKENAPHLKWGVKTAA